MNSAQIFSLIACCHSATTVAKYGRFSARACYPKIGANYRVNMVNVQPI
jgi:hypothetical protein